MMRAFESQGEKADKRPWCEILFGFVAAPSVPFTKQEVSFVAMAQPESVWDVRVCS